MASNDDIEKGKTDHLKSMKSASINALFKKSRKMNKISTTEKTKPLGKKYAFERQKQLISILVLAVLI